VLTMVNQDHNLMQPHRRDAIAHGWQAPYEQVQTLIREALVTHEMGTERWTCLGSIWYSIIWLYISFSPVDSYFSYDVFSHLYI
jgi:hypothetical protein